MAATTITLTPEQSTQLDELIATGRFTSAGDAVSYSIELLAQDSASPGQYSPSALARLDEGFAQVQRGEFVDQSEVKTLFEQGRGNQAS